MHLASEAITLECAVIGLAAAAGGIGYSVSRLAAKREQRPDSPADVGVKAAALGSLVFAAQMLNIPVLASSSVHFVGGVLLAEVLGPAVGVLTMSAVLLLQAVFFGDGGLAALGVNITNMALLPAGSLLLMRKLTAQGTVAVAAASVLSIVLAVLLIGGEVALGRSAADLAQWSTFVSAMLTNHLPLLPLECALTVAIVALLRAEKSDQRSAWRVPAAAATAAILIAAFALAASSTLPDGYESAAESAQMGWLIAGR
jgi:cobalt/nickel transport system permease protein